ncbi:MAG: hypothetical protein [Wendovervirus sonii]|uniref:BspA family leucine-rich repeat surface protein n=1 Tax=phage Lak_Megaphage_Sonny TaxID=3109229 RepID=A0ABZ0Z3H6_9CAUD|nr:MAG: hypothetical protein [phage Lak_Megaphage_Sonny]
MEQIYNKIYEAINTGIQKALVLDDEDDISIIYQHKKISNNFNIDKLLQERQDEYKKLIENKDFQGCFNLYNSEYLHFEKQTIGYKVRSKEELQKLVNNVNIYYNKNDNFDLNWIDVSAITDMSELFMNLHYFNCDISKWDVSNVKNMSYMFYYCKKFNADLSQWDVSNVEDMCEMFAYCQEFNADLSQWNVSNVKDMSFMFDNCEKFNADLSQWDVSNVEDMQGMFWNCPIFNSDLSKWEVSKVKNMSNMFAFCREFNSDLSGWNVLKVDSFNDTFFQSSLKNENKPKFKYLI